MTYGSGNTRVIAALCWRAASFVVTGVTIGGTALSQVPSALANVSATDFVDMWETTAPLAGSSGDVQVTFSGAPAGSHNGVALYNLVTTTPTPSANNSANGVVVTTLGTTLTIPAGGGAIVAANAENSNITSSTNFTTDFSHGVGGNSGQEWFGHTTTTGSVTPTVNASTTDNLVITAVAWGP